MIYFIILVISLVVFFGISQLINFPSIKDPVFHFFIQQVSTLTIVISLFATIITGGRTIFILLLPIYLFFIHKKNIIFVIPKKEGVIQNLRFILLLIPILFIQIILNVDIFSLTPYLPSDDVLLYSGFSNGLIEYGNENKYETLNLLYPNLFSGISPYHFYEIWFTSLVGFITGKGYAFLYLFVVSPYLVWLFVLGILSAFEHFNSKLRFKHYVISLLLLFVGPVYLTIYETLFHDGDFFSSTVFTIAGFVKQTLSFSYYGQKHLPVYIFSILSLLFLLKQKYSLSIVTGLVVTICSFGTLPGLFGGFGLLFLSQKLIRTKKNFLILLIISIGILGFISIFKLGINTEISERTFYTNDFLKYLNLKGELLRFILKIIVPLLWFSILYFPFIVLIWIYKKPIFKHPQLKLLFLFVLFMFGAGTLSLSLVQGLNSDQFITNLMPILNIAVIITIIYLFQTESSKKLFQYSLLLCVGLNIFFLVNFHFTLHKRIYTNYSQKTVKTVTQLLRKEKTNPLIAYILPDSTIEKLPPVIWYTLEPGKPFALDNYFNLININYPYTQYQRNSASIAFAPDNQMRFYLKDKVILNEDFGKYQKMFLKQKMIRWLFCAKGAKLSPQLESLIEKKYYDKLSGEMYCRLKKE